MSVDTLAEKWYVDFRVGHWNGALAQNKPGYVTLTPLVRPDVARTSVELSERARSAHRLHYEVMRRVAPDLLRVPLMNDVWDPDNRRAAGGGVPAEPFPTTLRPTHRTLGSWQYRFVEEQAAEIRSLLDRARRETELDAICDVARLQVAARPRQT